MFRSFATYCNKLLAKDLHVRTGDNKYLQNRVCSLFHCQHYAHPSHRFKLSTATFSNVPFSILIVWCELCVCVCVCVCVYTHTHTHTHTHTYTQFTLQARHSKNTSLISSRPNLTFLFKISRLSVVSFSLLIKLANM